MQLISFDGTSHLYRKYIRFKNEPDAIKASVPKLLSCLGSVLAKKAKTFFDLSTVFQLTAPKGLVFECCKTPT